MIRDRGDPSRLWAVVMAGGTLVLLGAIPGPALAQDSRPIEDARTQPQRSVGPTKGEDESSESPSGSLSARLNAVLNLIERGRFEAARARLRSMTKQFPESSRAVFLTALTYHKERRYGLAEPLFARALALDPADSSIRIFYGWCSYYLGKPAEARTMFEAFVDQQPNYSDAHYALGLLDYEAGELESAQQRFRRAIELGRAAGSRVDEAKARVRLGDCLMIEGILAEANQEFQYAIRLDGRLYGAWFKLSRVLDRLGEEAEAARARRMHDSVRRKIHPVASGVDE